MTRNNEISRLDPLDREFAWPTHRFDFGSFILDIPHQRKPKKASQYERTVTVLQDETKLNLMTE
jgi:hypothetical protein